MGRYHSSSSFRKPASFNEDQAVHPIWRGIGFVLLILTPILGFGIAYLLVDENFKKGWIPIPYELLSPWLHQYLFIYAGLTLLVSFVLYGVFQLFTFLIYRFFGPSRYGPVDAPPIHHKVKKSR